MGSLTICGGNGCEIASAAGEPPPRSRLITILLYFQLSVEIMCLFVLRNVVVCTEWKARVTLFDILIRTTVILDLGNRRCL